MIPGTRNLYAETEVKREETSKLNIEISGLTEEFHSSLMNARQGAG
jgi:hypothetical protein